ncbi:NAD(P)-dependent oxidoreductase [Streptomyces sp. LP05-1]|uniref:NAD(P)-dependent oxidoreductase n=2 Tax=Streptomyces pyxinae TaxID=2970734 RepID=A0ABT2CHH3_9ACTN|nr:NAD(P)-dependent oxidoreductase [Streptomyces sp. LP05-1]
MGAAMARSMLRSGLDVRVWNRTREKADALVADGARSTASPAEAVSGAGVVLTALRDGPTVLDALREAAPGLAPGAVLAQTATVGATATAELAGWARDHELVFVDAPVVGTRQPAETGELLILAAGPESARDRLAPVFDAIGRATTWVSDDGAGAAASRLKLVVNSWIAALTHATGETLALARGLGVDPAVFLDSVAGGPLDNGYLRAKAAAVLAGDYRPNFSVSNALKDARLIGEAAEGAGLRLDLAAAGAARFERLDRHGRGEDDMAASYLASFDPPGRDPFEHPAPDGGQR